MGPFPKSSISSPKFLRCSVFDASTELLLNPQFLGAAKTRQCLPPVVLVLEISGTGAEGVLRITLVEGGLSQELSPGVGPVGRTDGLQIGEASERADPLES